MNWRFICVCVGVAVLGILLSTERDNIDEPFVSKRVVIAIESKRLYEYLKVRNAFLRKRTMRKNDQYAATKPSGRAFARLSARNTRNEQCRRHVARRRCISWHSYRAAILWSKMLEVKQTHSLAGALLQDRIELETDSTDENGRFVIAFQSLGELPT